MEILITKRREIIIDGELMFRYLDSSSFFSLRTIIEISGITDRYPKLILKSKLNSPIHRSFDINRGDEVFYFRIKKAWKTQYNCQVGNDLYEIYSHRGRKFSVFKNNMQIAWWESNLVVLLGNKYRIIADKNSDYELLIAFCIILNNSSDGSTFDLGNVGAQGKVFDSHWQPKY